MARVRRLVAKIRNNPTAVRYDELVTVLAAIGWQRQSGRGSHQRFGPAAGGRFLVVVRPHGGRPYVSPRAVAEVLALWDSQPAEAPTDEDADG